MVAVAGQETNETSPFFKLVKDSAMRHCPPKLIISPAKISADIALLLQERSSQVGIRDIPQKSMDERKRLSDKILQQRVTTNTFMMMFAGILRKLDTIEHGKKQKIEMEKVIDEYIGASKQIVNRNDITYIQKITRLLLGDERYLFGESYNKIGKEYLDIISEQIEHLAVTMVQHGSSGGPTAASIGAAKNVNCTLAQCAAMGDTTSAGLSHIGATMGVYKDFLSAVLEEKIIAEKNFSLDDNKRRKVGYQAQDRKLQEIVSEQRGIILHGIGHTSSSVVSTNYEPTVKDQFGNEYTDIDVRISMFNEYSKNLHDKMNHFLDRNGSALLQAFEKHQISNKKSLMHIEQIKRLLVQIPEASIDIQEILLSGIKVESKSGPKVRQMGGNVDLGASLFSAELNVALGLVPQFFKEMEGFVPPWDSMHSIVKPPTTQSVLLLMRGFSNDKWAAETAGKTVSARPLLQFSDNLYDTMSGFVLSPKQRGSNLHDKLIQFAGREVYEKHLRDNVSVNTENIIRKGDLMDLVYNE